MVTESYIRAALQGSKCWRLLYNCNNPDHLLSDSFNVFLHLLAVELLLQMLSHIVTSIREHDICHKADRSDCAFNVQHNSLWQGAVLQLGTLDVTWSQQGDDGTIQTTRHLPGSTYLHTQSKQQQQRSKQTCIIDPATDSQMASPRQRPANSIVYEHACLTCLHHSCCCWPFAICCAVCDEWCWRQ